MLDHYTYQFLRKTLLIPTPARCHIFPNSAIFCLLFFSHTEGEHNFNRLDTPFAGWSSWKTLKSNRGIFHCRIYFMNVWCLTWPPIKIACVALTIKSSNYPRLLVNRLFIFIYIFSCFFSFSFLTQKFKVSSPRE